MRVLHISLDTAMGGIESFLLNVYRMINRDKIQFDFIEYGEQNRDFDSKFLELGANIYKVPDRKKHPISSKMKLEGLLRTNQYRIVHIHKNSLSEVGAIEACKRVGVGTIIVHSHNSSRDSKIVSVLHKINRKRINFDGIYKLSCSVIAANWLFGTNNNVRTIKNGIDTSKFDFDPVKREKTRRMLGLSDECLVIGNIGRLTEQKNPLFSLEIIKLLKNDNVKLLWVGDGNLREVVEEKIREYDIEDKVILTGAVTNPEIYYLAMDIFIMPSHYEGFPIASVEAQCSGLPVVLSTKITKEAELTETVAWVENDDAKSWVKEINEFSKIINNRESKRNCLIKNGYDMQSTVEFLQDFYLSRI